MAEAALLGRLWPGIHSHEDALGLIRQSGLAPFLLGIGHLIVLLFWSDAPGGVALHGLLGLGLVGIGLLLRARRSAFAPVGCGYALVFCLWAVTALLRLAMVSILVLPLMFLAVVLAALPLALAIMAVNGLRGWLWLRRHRG